MREQLATVLHATLLCVAIVTAFWNGIQGAFVFDDIPSILENPTIRSWATALTPPGGGTTVSARPFLNFTFAINYATSEYSGTAYHLSNIAVHILTAFVLYGVIRRTLNQTVLSDRFGANSSWLACASALVWAVHPLQVESVTYVVQRAESLAALCFLVTMYCFIRSIQSPRGKSWVAASVAACLIGAATKETVVVAPMVALLYDRTFVATSFGAAWRARWRTYCGLGSTWILLGWLVLASNGRGGTAGFASPATWWEYSLLQFPAITRYCRLALWPHPLVFDYGPFQAVNWPAALRSIPLVAAALVLTGWMLIRNRPAGFAAATFFLLLAPTTSIVPITSQIMAEHRMYLPFALLAVGFVALLSRLFPTPAVISAVALLAGAEIVATVHRNTVYVSALALWSDTATAIPQNPRAHLNLGEALIRERRLTEATEAFRTALQLQPNYVGALYNLGTALLAQNQPSAAIAPLTRALELDPQFDAAAYNLGNAYASLAQPDNAAKYYAAAAIRQPNNARLRYNYGNALVALHRFQDAAREYEETIRLTPGDTNAHFNLANALMELGEPARAIPHYEMVLQREPADRDAQRNLAIAQRSARAAAARN